MKPSFDTLKSAQAAYNVFEGFPQAPSDCNGGQCVLDIVCTRYAQIDRPGMAVHGQVKTDPFRSAVLDIDAADVVSFRQAESDRFSVKSGGVFHEQSVIAIQHDFRFRRQFFHHFRFGFGNTVYIAQPLQMNHSHIQNGRHMGVCNFSQPGDFTFVVHPHFQHRPLVGLFQFQKCYGQSDEVVVVARVFQGPVAHFQNGGSHFLGGGFPRTPREGGYFGVMLPAPPGRQISQSPEGVIHLDDHSVRSLFKGDLKPFFNHHACGTLPNRPGNKIMAVEPVPFEGPEDIALAGGP